MATLPDRVARLEEVIGSSATGALVARVVHLEVCCLGSAAAGPLLQRTSKLEELIGCDPGTAPVAPIAAPVAPVTPVAAVAVAAVAAVADGPAEVADAAASSQDVAAEAPPEAPVAALADGPAEVVDAAASSQVDQPEVFALPAAKRRRCNELRQEGGYQLEANAGSVAPNPKAFKVHPLREEQLRSLAWMYSREACRDGFKGGMLADKMGYGKTATTIGMLSEKPGQVPDERPSGYIRNPATLILCPPHLVEQWEGEFFKFLGDEVQLLRPTPPSKAKDRETLALPPIPFTGSQLFTVDVRDLSELSEEVHHHNARLTPEKRLQEGDNIESLLVQLPPGYFFVTEDSGGERRASSTRTATWNFQHFLDENCRPGCTVQVTVRREKKPRIEPFRGDGPFRILTIANSKDFARLRLKDLLPPEPFNVVLVSTGILGSERHMMHVSQVVCSWHGEKSQSMLCDGKPMSVRQKMLHECVDKWHQKDSFLRAALATSPTLLETMWWNRMVLDEFHESESWITRVREVMKSLGATYRWGLSGTPPLDTTDAVLEVAELLWYATDATAPFMSEALKHRKSRKQDSKTWLADEENKQKIHGECQAMIRDVVRQNSSQLVEAIAVQEHEEFVQFTAQERLIYRQACHDHEMFVEQLAYEGASVDTREALLKRCAHFCLEMDAGDAGEAVRFLGRRKRAHIEQLQQQLELEACRAAHLSVWESCKHGLLAHKAQHAEAEKFIHEVYQTSEQVWKEKDPEKKSFEMQIVLYDQNGERRLRPEVRFKQPFRDAHVYPRLNFRHLVQHAVARKCVHSEPRAERLLSQLQVCAQIPCRDPQHLPVAMSAGFQVLANLLDTAHRSLDFYTGQMRSLSDIESLRNEQCSVCLTPKDDLAALVMLPCSHIFHRDCVRSALETNPKCPYCRAHAPKKSMSSVLLEVEVATSAAEPLPAELRSHGSKLLAVARRLQKIRTEDPKAKAIVFVQWQELENKVARALQGHGLPVLQLPRGKNAGREMATVMKSFTTSEEAFVLLLSLEHAASGSNLTAANHVILVHPMNADTLSSAVAYERQALARVRRVGQERAEVHVWRFVTRETVEEHMHQLHCRADPPDQARGGGA
ncbi:unnamed protein product [Cladocopium goreaui]|uniref:DNA repair protein RAD5B (Putativ e SWI/SNF-related matrix-associated actin-dependent regulator of chromatin subfamily A member 3-like 3) (SMARCA3-like protein 3) (RAD5 homolog B) (AtRAD5B) n=1 Tax=Cladocopium goreaui TaxID=2562237 RepID=A0A9P1DTG5_9DINO|nr:unnamed protein product [Cladocopium goreaui]